MHDEVPYSGPVRLFGAAGKNQESRSQSGDLPVDKQGDKVTCKHRTNRASDIQHCRNVLGCIAYMQCVERRDEGGDVKDVTEDKAQAVHAHRQQTQTREFYSGEDPLGKKKQLRQAKCRQQQCAGGLRSAGQQRQQQSPHQNDDPRGQASHRNSVRPA